MKTQQVTCSVGMPPILDPAQASLTAPLATRRPDSVLPGPPRRVPAVAICPVAGVRVTDALAIERGAVGR